MSFDRIIREERIPLTKEKLIHDLIRLGVNRGDNLIVHTSLNQLGYIIGKEQTLVEAIIEVVGDEGLIVMPTQTSDNSKPEDWSNPPVPKSWVLPIKQHLPAYDKDITPSRGMGAVPEYFRKLNGVYRSNHPQVSFAAYGKNNIMLLKKHPLEYSLNDESPLGLMYKWNFKILMLGTDYETCTAMHLSEYRSNCRKQITQECAAQIDNKRRWIEYPDLDVDSDIFNEIGTMYEKAFTININKVGYAESRYLDMVTLIDFTTKYLSK